MSTAIDPVRHLTRDGLEEYLAAGAPAVVKIEGHPNAYLIIDPGECSLSIRFPHHDGHVPDVQAYRNLSVTSLVWENSSWDQLTVHDDELLDVYPVLCAVADRVQLDGLGFGDATRVVLAAYRELLSAKGRLTDAEEIGLFGELLVLRRLISLIGERDAVRAWRGPTAEEHDFGLSTDDLEIKTTTAEKRHHWISTLEQLAPTPERGLWLVSIQLTTAGIGGRTLTNLVHETRLALGDRPHQSFEKRLAAAQWHDEQASVYARNFRLRSAPAVFSVSAEFPAITTPVLAGAGLDPVHFPQVSYMVDLTGIAPAFDPPAVVAGLFPPEGGS